MVLQPQLDAHNCFCHSRVHRAADKKHGRGIMLYGTDGKASNGEYSWYCRPTFVCCGSTLLTLLLFYRSAGDKYDGEWVNHQRHGNCTYTWNSGEVFFPMPLDHFTVFFLCQCIHVCQVMRFAGTGMRLEQRRMRRMEGQE
jgi:hypothetical protein